MDLKKKPSPKPWIVGTRLIYLYLLMFRSGYELNVILISTDCPFVVPQKRRNKWRFRNVLWKSHQAEVKKGWEERVISDWDAVPTAGQHHEFKLERTQDEWERPVFVLATCAPKVLTVLSKCRVLGTPSVWPGKLQPTAEITILLPSHGTKTRQKHSGHGALLKT